MMKRNLKKALAIMLALLLTGSAFVDYYVSARADNPAESIAADETGGQNGGAAFADDSIMPLADESGQQKNDVQITVTINGQDIDSVTNIHQGDKIQISINWILKNTQTGVEDEDGKLTETCTVQLNPATNVKIPNTETPRELRDINGKVIGYAEVKDNVITMVIKDETFLKNEKNRGVYGVIKGEISVEGQTPEDGDEVYVDLGDAFHGTFIWDNNDPDSYLWNNKQARTLEFDKANNKWVQTYTVTIGSENGGSTIDEIVDDHGTGLGDIYSIHVESSIEDSALNDRTVNRLEDLKGLKLKAGEQITLTYKMDVAATSGNEDFIFDVTDDSLTNSVSVKWTDNKKVKKTTDPAKANLNIKGPSVSKSLVASESDDDRQVWEIVIDLGDLKQLDKKLEDILENLDESIIEDLGDALEAYQGAKLTWEDFELQPDGTYKATFETTLKDDYKKSESTIVSNTVKIRTKYKKYPEFQNGASYTTGGTGTGASISKKVNTDKYVGGYNSETGRISWKVVLSGISADATNVYITDHSLTYSGAPNGKKWGTHNLITTLMVNGAAAIQNGKITSPYGEGIIKTTDQWGGAVDYNSSDTVYFLDKFIKDNAGKDIVLIYETEVADKEATMKNVQFYNDATLFYTPAKGREKSVTDSDVYENPDAAGDALFKSGVADEKNATITYTLRVELDSLDLKNGDVITITDTLPEGLTYVDQSAGIVEKFFDYGGSLPDNLYYDPSQDPPIQWHQSSEEAIHLPPAEHFTTKCDGNILTFTIPIDQYFAMKRLYGTPYNLFITFNAQVADLEAFVEAGVNKTFRNEAQGTYNGTDLTKDPVHVTNTLHPNKVNVVSKNAEPVGRNAKGELNTVEFTVDVNPGTYDLADGDLTAVDTLGTDLSYDLTTVKVFEMGVDGPVRELTIGEDYNFAYSPFDNSLTFTLPDETYLRITYTAKPTAPKASGDIIEVSNSFRLSGTRMSDMQDGVEKRVVAMQDDWRGYSDLGTIKLRKYWSDNGNTKAVVGSRFQICEAELVGDTLVANWNTNPRYFEITSDDVDDSGNYSELDIDGLEFNKYYALREVYGGASVDDNKAMDNNPTPYFFVIHGSDGKLNNMKVPVGCKEFTLIGTEDYPNEASTGEKGIIKIAKIWEEQDTNMLSWDDIKDSLTFTINGKVIDGEDYEATLSGDDLIYVSGNRFESKNFSVPFGTYTVTEEYEDTDDFKVVKCTYQVVVDGTTTTGNNYTIGSAANIVTFEITNTYDYTGAFPIKTSKVDVTSQDEIGGAELEVLDSKGEVVESWTSEDGKTHEFELLPGEYTLREKIAPIGYELATDIHFQVDELGDVYLTDTTPNEKLDDFTIIMEDNTRAPLDIEVDKVALTDGSTEVKDATLELYVYDDQEDEWVFKAWHKSEGPEGKAWQIGGYLQIGGKYKLVEKSAPDGYGYSEAIEFTVDEDGNIQDVQYADGGTDTVSRDTTEKGTERNKILMQDKAISVSLRKVDSKGLAVVGAEISVYLADDMTRPVCSWRTESSTGAKDFGIELHADPEKTLEYVIMETKIPAGYKPAEPIHIWVTPDGTVLDKPESEGKEITAPIVMEDEEYATLVITKTISCDDDLTQTELEAAKDGITFQVQGKDNSYGPEEFTLDNVELVDGKYVIELELTPGTYTVKETVEDPDGVKHSSSYTITTSGGELATDGIELKRGGKVTIDYTNTYSYKTGKIYLTKSFTSSDDKITWDMIKDTLMFNVYEGTETTGEPFATVSGTDLGWKPVEGKKNQYVYELDDVKLGTYTVVEECSSIDDDVRLGSYKVTADMNPGAEGPQTGDTVTVTSSAITLKEQDEEVTITASNTYTYVGEFPVKVSKIDAVSKDEIGGARLEVLDSEGEVVEEWTSEAGKTHEFELMPGEYTLREKLAPQGYGIATDIEFTVNELGEIYLTDAPNEKLESLTIIMQDKAISVSLRKVDLKGLAVVGAEISVYLADDMTKPVGSWKTDDPKVIANGGVMSFGGFLTVDPEKTLEYVIMETKTPAGYKKAEPIHIWVTPDGKVLDKQKPDGKEIMAPIEMVDKEYATLVITKTISSDGLTQTELEAVKGGIAFQVQGEDYLGNPYEPQTFTLENVEPVNGKYVIELELTPGTYTVTETVEDPDGVKHSITYTISTTGKSRSTGELSLTTDDIELNRGDKVTVDYTNTYSYKTGKIYLTKSFTSSDGKLTWDMIKCTLTFNVYEGDAATGKLVATVKGDAQDAHGWTQVDNQYVYELEEKLGTYTVVEECSSIDDDVRSGTYEVTADMDPGTGGPQTGDTVTVTSSAITLEEQDDEVTVTASNTYTYVGKFPVKVSKIDATSREEIGGAWLEVLDSEGEVVESWRSEDGKTHELKLMPGEYTLRETVAPIGYGLAIDIHFKVDELGNVFLTDTTPNERLEGFTVIMEDAAREPLDIEVAKIKSGDPSVGVKATLELYFRKDQSEQWERIGEHPFDSNEAWQIGGYLQLGGRYKLVEKEAPAGYGYSAAIEFTVDEDGNIQDVKYADGVTGTVSTTGNKILMEDKVISVSLRKVDNTSLKNPVEGAEISIYRIVNGEPKAEAEYSWPTTSDSGAVDFGFKLQADANDDVDYVIMETVTPKGYKTADPIYIRVKPDGTVFQIVDGREQPISGSIEMVDEEYATLVIEKTIKGKLTLDEIDGGLKFEVKGTESYGPFTIKKDFKKINGDTYRLELQVKPGAYTVTETVETGEGVKCSKSYTITVNGSPNPGTSSNSDVLTTDSINLAKGDKVTVAYENTYDTIEGTIKLRKSFASSGDQLTWDEIAQTLTFYIKEGTVERYVISGTASGTAGEWKPVDGEKNLYEYVLDGVKIGKSYTVEEVCRPIDDYVRVTTYMVEVGDSAGPGTAVSGTEASNVEVEDGKTTTVTYSNTYVSPVFITKKDVTSQKEIEGAELTVSAKDNKTKDGSDFTPITWTSGKEPYKLQLKPGEYTLTENIAPQGYAKADEIKFKIDIDSDGKDKITITSPSDSENLLNGRTITMGDTPLTFNLNKMAFDDNAANKVGVPLKDAIIELYEVKDDGSREYKAMWTSDGTNAPHDFGPCLSINKNYVLVETRAPQGYLITKEITFSVQSNGDVKIGGVRNDNYYQGSDGVIYMLDEKSAEPLVSLVLTKSIEGVDYAEAGKLLNGKLTFTVECISGDGSTGYEEPLIFTVGEEGFRGLEWDKDEQKFIRHVTNLKPGTYKVTESWTYSDLLVCRKQSYEIEINKADGNTLTTKPVQNAANGTDKFGTDTGIGLTEDEDQAKVHFTNTYEMKETLVITKTIAGDVTKEEVEGALKFTVTDNATKKNETYVLKDDFDYDEETKIWSKELTVAAGGYTIREIVTAPSGKTYTAKYTVNGGTSKNSKKAGDVVEVKPGGTTTVAYTNTYSKKTSGSGKDRSGSSGGGGGGSSDDTSVLALAASTVTTALTQTGDSVPLGMWVALFVCGGAGVMVSSVAMKRRRKKN